ncbi:lysophospholipid acyltransferase family protein [Asanoa sp. NPDC050611]|uniref:lysophospholipid acyltransferase family protein n=1 Tax=Asanoa sp. NPDC050611 TaxID=3157098 RepID=UPI0033EFBDAC
MNLWRPQNDCGTDCLLTGDERTEPPKALQVLRFVRLLGALLVGALLVPILPLLTEKGRDRAGQAWGRLTLAALGITVRLRGRAPRGKALVVANHVSWLDIVALLAVAPGRMLAKVEVRRWPLFGALAASGGTIFVDRARPKTLPDTVADVAAALRAGAVVTVFPEGTTGCGASVGTFRPAMFQAAIDAGATIVPVTLRYGGPEASFIGEETLWESVRRVLALPKPVVSVSVAAALHPEPAASRRSLARVAQAAVGTPVFLPAPVEETPVPVPLALAA